MKLNVKRIYCRNCRKLVRGREQEANGKLRISCSRCGRLICFQNSLTWRFA